MKRWTLIWAFLGDREVERTQLMECIGDDAEECARSAGRDHEWLADWELIAAVEGAATIRVHDDNSRKEYALK